MTESASKTKRPPTRMSSNLLLGHYRDRSQRRAKGKRAHIPHENFRRVGVIPQKAEPGADSDPHRMTEFARHPARRGSAR